MNTVTSYLPTEFGEFNIHVYPDQQGKETIVLTTKNLDINIPVLVRVHSECITGDTFGSYKCDCGPQKNESLKMIANSGNGMFIYLRQEGRGIGLYEKIKSYRLQELGHDTHEANILLGHKPDAREYKMVEQIFKDFGVSEIKLITNNPSKVHEISQFEVKIIERIPLIIESNSHNKFYFETKLKKFQHNFSENTKHYFYGIHGIQNADQAKEICSFFENKILDPSLRIFISNNTLKTLEIRDPEIQNNAKNIYNCVSKYNSCIPNIHVSFLDSINPVVDIEYIIDNFGYFKFLQINDLSLSQMKDIIQISKNHFNLRIALDNKNCDDFMRDEELISMIISNNISVIIDNSCGKGVKDTEENFMKKIQLLLNTGINSIILAGGFGPVDLDIYFNCREYFKINLSIDAESQLKTDGIFDIDKGKKYISRLLNHDRNNHSQ